MRNCLRPVLLSCLVGAVWSMSAFAGGPFHEHCRQCAPAVHAAPVVISGCACAVAAAPCCGISGGVAHLGHVYGMGYGPSSSMVSPGVTAWRDPFRHANDPFTGPFAPDNSWYRPTDGWTGYEGLPVMDGGGVNYRYPYHSYRRPWAHPGPRVVNVNIVW